MGRLQSASWQAREWPNLIAYIESQTARLAHD